MKTKYVEFTNKGVVEVKEADIDISNLSPTEVVIENEATIISAGTELALLNGEDVNIGGTFPARPGYGSIARVLAVGEGIKDVKAGDRVFCAGKHASVQRFIHENIHQWEHLFPVPEDMDPVEATLGCMAQIAITGPNVTSIKMGDTVAVFGLGVVGVLAAIMYKLKGARVIGVDPVKERCEVAKQLGLEIVVDCAPAQQIGEVKKLTNGKGAEVTVDAVGHTAVIMNCIKSTADMGEIILLGSPRAAMEGNITEAFWDVHLNGKTIKGAHMYHFPLLDDRGTTYSVQWNFNTVFNLIKDKKLDVRKLISHVIRPEDAPQAYDGLANKKNEYTCVVIDWRK